MRSDVEIPGRNIFAHLLSPAAILIGVIGRQSRATASEGAHPELQMAHVTQNGRSQMSSKPGIYMCSYIYI